jgi:hypothetical protein
VRLPNFCGGSCPEASVNASAERTRNLYPHVIAGGQPPNNPILYRIPGLRTFATLGGDSTRGCLEINGRAFAVAGDTFYEIASDGTETAYGPAVMEDDNPATLSSNGTAGDQIFVTSGGYGYIFDLTANTITEIADSDFPQGEAKMGAFVDGYFVVLNSTTGAFQLSALEDGTAWDALDVGQVSTSSDLVKALIVHDRQIWLFGGSTTSIWYNSGNSAFPFEPINNILHQGIVGDGWSAQRMDNTVFWVGKNEHGAGVLYRGQQGAPQRVSTHAIEQIWNGYTSIDDCVAYTEQWLGHSFYHLYIPDAADAADNDNAVSWVYDASVPAQLSWHERALWNTSNATWSPMVGRCHMYAFGKHLIGDRRTGALYEQRADLYHLELVTV